VESVDLVEDGLPVREVGLLLGGVDEGELGGNAVGVVWVFGAALGFTPGVFGSVEAAQADVFRGRPGRWRGSLLRAGHERAEQQQACQRESCVRHSAILRSHLTYAKGLGQKRGAVGYAHFCIRI